MIHDISPETLDNRYFPDIFPDSGSIVFIFSGRSVLCRGDVPDTFPTYGELRLDAVTYLLTVGGRKCFLAENAHALSDDLVFADIRSFRSTHNVQRHLIFAALTAYHLNTWYSSNRFCGTCGGRMTHDTAERAMRCEKCGRIVYPRINPAVIVGVVNGGRLLVTRYANRPETARDVLIAGFTEIGETPEQTVAREVMEEVGLRVKNIRYYRSQPWGLTSCLLMGFFCELDGDDTVHLDESELKSAAWVTRGEIDCTDDFSLTSEMMLHFKNHNCQ